VSSQPLPSCQDLLREGVALFNRGDFFECHEVLEAAWLQSAGEQKRFLQGLIQVAVAFYHLRRKNFAGAERLLRAAIEKLSSAMKEPPVDVAELLGHIGALPARIERGEIPADCPAPELRLAIPPPVLGNSP
jgi:hypothetical protein